MVELLLSSGKIALLILLEEIETEKSLILLEILLNLELTNTFENIVNEQMFVLLAVEHPFNAPGLDSS